MQERGEYDDGRTSVVYSACAGAYMDSPTIPGK